MTEANALVPNFKVRWSWKSNGAGISAIKPVGRRHVLIGENSGAVSCIDAINGKLLWTRDGLLPAWQVDPSQEDYSYHRGSVSHLGRSGFTILPLRESDDVLEPDRFCVGGSSSVSCYSLKDGKLKWRADVGASARKPGAEPVKSDMYQAAVSVFAINDQHNLLTWEPQHSTLANI
ncbi:MAG: PQQ-binding-like beta-propeller repeat protein, partial [Planctomycetota bacterium]|nr:PQQ-binding-like beta-propeller repeat protein [Planctomycetota bacterium]